MGRRRTSTNRSSHCTLQIHLIVPMRLFSFVRWVQMKSGVAILSLNHLAVGGISPWCIWPAHDRDTLNEEQSRGKGKGSDLLSFKGGVKQCALLFTQWNNISALQYHRSFCKSNWWCRGRLSMQLSLLWRLVQFHAIITAPVLPTTCGPQLK